MEQIEAQQTGVATFDATPYELNDTAVLHVVDAGGMDPLVGPDGEEVTIEIYGPGSAQAVKMAHQSGRKAALRTAALIRGKVSQNAGSEADDERVDKLVAITAAVNHFPHQGGARGMYANPKLCYIADQVDAFFNDKTNFSKGSSGN